MTEEDIEIIRMTEADWDRALQNSLDELGLTWEELAAQARARDFTSLRAHNLWLITGGRGFSGT
jgi:hypothetical protein